MSCADDDDDCSIDQCKYWDEDGCYCVCGAMCSCEPFHPTKPLRTSDEGGLGKWTVHEWPENGEGW